MFNHNTLLAVSSSISIFVGNSQAYKFPTTQLGHIPIKIQEN